MKRRIRTGIEGVGASFLATASMYMASEIEAARSAGGCGRERRPRPRVNDRSWATSSRHTGQRSKCSSIATRAGRDTQSSTYNEIDCPVSSHDIKGFPIAIAFTSKDRDDNAWMADRPRLLP